MKEKLQAVLEKAKVFFQDKKKRNLTIAGGVALLAAAIVVAVVLNNKPYVVLATGLPTDETSAIVTKLEEYGALDYKIQNNDTVLVPQDQESNLRAKLLMDGYPKNGFGYETYFSKISGMSTESDRETVKLFDLQERMAATIRSFQGVKSAVVTISPAEDRSSLLDSQNMTKASASVLVTMQDGGELPKQYATAIGKLISTAVKDLAFEDITIVDSLGNSYDATADSAAAGDASDLKFRLEKETNNRVRNEVMKVLTPIFGAENVIVAVQSTVDVSHSVEEATVYSTPEGAQPGTGILGSRVYEQGLTRDQAQANGGVPGTENNADIPTYMNQQGAVNGNETSIYNKGTEENKVNQQRTQSENKSGIVTDISVAVTVNQNVVGEVDVAGTFTDHVARAAGIDRAVQNDKISIVTAPFFVDTSGVAPEPGVQLPDWAYYAIAAGVGLLLLLMLLLILIGRHRRKKQQRMLEAMAAAAAEQEQVMAQTVGGEAEQQEVQEILQIRNEKSMELKKEIREFADSNPEITAQMIKTWLRGDGSDD